VAQANRYGVVRVDPDCDFNRYVCDILEKVRAGTLSKSRANRELARFLGTDLATEIINSVPK
jgi:hypothetical protein